MNTQTFWACAPKGLVPANVRIEEDGQRNQGRQGTTTGAAKTTRSGLMQVLVNIDNGGGLRWVSYFHIIN